MYYLYHISDNKDLKQGYIGYSKQPEIRWKQHSQNNSTVGRTIRENDWTYENNLRIIFEGTRDECAAYETQLRPEMYMGLNEASGGYGGDVAGLSERWKKERVGEGNPNWNKKRTDKTKQKQSKSMKKYYNSDRYTEEQQHIHKNVLPNLGAGAVRNTTWWNNGTENKRSETCPGDEWIEGRLPYDRTYKEIVFYAKAQKGNPCKPVVIDGVEYFSIMEAVRQTGYSKPRIRRMNTR